MVFRKFGIAALIAVSIAAAGSASVFAHGGATGIVKERMDAMEMLQNAMKSVGTMMQGATGYDAERVRKAASILANHSGKAMTKLFPEGSIKKPSEARPAIWKDWKAFSADADRLNALAGQLSDAASEDDAVMPQTVKSAFIEIGRTCSSCHEKFRLKK